MTDNTQQPAPAAIPGPLWTENQRLRAVIAQLRKDLDAARKAADQEHTSAASWQALYMDAIGEEGEVQP